MKSTAKDDDRSYTTEEIDQVLRDCDHRSKEFASKGLGITAKRTPNAFTEALLELEHNYDKYKKTVEVFKKYLKWDLIARNHIELYHNITNTGPGNKDTVTIAKKLTDPTLAQS